MGVARLIVTINHGGLALQDLARIMGACAIARMEVLYDCRFGQREHLPFRA